MTIEIGGEGHLGLAFETTLGTYVAPTKFIPIRSESLQKVEDKQYRTNIRGIADRTKGPRGNTHIEGEVEFEMTRDNLLYFLYAGRYSIAKADTAGVAPFTYTFTPVHVTKPTTAAGATTRKTLSLFVNRGDRGFAYTGCTVVSWSLTFDNEIAVVTANIMGVDEAEQTVDATTFSTSEVYGPEHNTIEIPSASARSDISTADFSSDNGGSVEHRLDGSRAPSFVRWGEREVTMSAEHDFDTDSDYDAFIAATEQDIIIKSSRSATNDQVTITLNATITDSYEVNLNSLGDLVTASVSYHATYDGAVPYTVEILTTEDIT